MIGNEGDGRWQVQTLGKAEKRARGQQNLRIGRQTRRQRLPRVVKIERPPVEVAIPTPRELPWSDAIQHLSIEGGKRVMEFRS